MKLIKVFSPSIPMHPGVNVLGVRCDECRISFVWPSNVSLVTCPQCGTHELWHDVRPKPQSGPWSEPVMTGAGSLPCKCDPICSRCRDEMLEDSLA